MQQSKKRTTPSGFDSNVSKIGGSGGKKPIEETEDNLMFEDPFGDDSEEEEEEIVESNEENVEMVEQEQEQVVKKVFLPNQTPLEKDQVLDYDPSAYDMYFSMTAEWPALSIDVIPDQLGACRTKFPMTAYVVAGTQAASKEDNQVTIMKMSELHRTSKVAEEDDEDIEEDDEEGDPVLESRSIDHFGGVNRIRCMPQSSNIVATWADTGKVHMWDIAKQLQSLDGGTPAGLSSKSPPIYTFSGHPEEGYAMDWSPVEQGRFLSGDGAKYIYLWNPVNGASWNVDLAPFQGHKSSVEDIQWSPTEASVFASCSSDQTVRIWDIRRKKASMLDVHAHNDDVNVISWNKNVSYLLVSGSDDGSFKIWDMRNFKSNSPVAHFRYHTAPITSVEWHPTDESVVAVAGADNQISVWDMSVEEDTEAVKTVSNSIKSTPSLDLPPQLLFIHQGQKDIKELHFHSQCPGVIVSTAIDGFNIFKPANIS